MYLSAGLVIAGKKDFCADGLMLYLILEPLMKFAVSGSHTGHRSRVLSFTCYYFNPTFILRDTTIRMFVLHVYGAG